MARSRFDRIASLLGCGLMAGSMALSGGVAASPPPSAAAEPYCPIRVQAGVHGFGGMSANPVPYDSLRAACIPRLVPLAAYGAGFATALESAGEVAPVFAPDGNVFVEAADTQGATAMREYTPQGRVAWNVPLPKPELPFSMAGTGQAVGAVAGATLWVLNERQHHVYTVALPLEPGCALPIAAAGGHFVVEEGCPAPRQTPGLSLLHTFAADGAPAGPPTQADLRAITSEVAGPLNLDYSGGGSVEGRRTVADGAFGVAQILARNVAFQQISYTLVVSNRVDAPSGVPTLRYPLSPLLPPLDRGGTSLVAWLYRSAGAHIALSPLFPGMALMWGGSTGTAALAPWGSWFPAPRRTP